MDADGAGPALGRALQRRLRAVEVLDAVAVVAGEHLAEAAAADDAVLVARRLADALVAVPVAVRDVLKLRLQHNRMRP